MKTSTSRCLTAALLASLSWVACAQNAPASPPENGSKPPRHEKRLAPPSLAERQAHFAKRSAELKAKLKLAAEQEPAWNTFISAVQPPSTPPRHPDPAEWAQLTTPERLNQMDARHQERSQQQAQRHQAIKTFYATLQPEQQKVFDAEALPLMGPPHPPMPPGHGAQRSEHRPPRQP